MKELQKFQFCLGYYEKFDRFYAKHKQIIESSIKGVGAIKCETKDEVLICEMYDLKQEPTLFLISLYNKNRTLLKQSFRFDYCKENGELSVIDWHIKGYDFITEKHIFNIKKQLEI